MADSTEPVEGFSMFIYDHGDGTASYTGSLNVQEWSDYLESSGNKAAAGYELPEGDLDPGTAPPPPQSASEATVLDPTGGADQAPPADEDTPDEGPQPPAGNASADEWRAYAVESGQATEEEVADLSRNDLRDKFGGE